jgi:hypothetical protein
VVVAVNPGVYEVVDHGRLLSYTTGDVYNVRVFDAFTVYVDGELVDPPLVDIVNAVAFAAAAATAITVVVLIGSADASRLRSFFSLLAAGMLFLMADDLLTIHESLGANLRFLADVPGVAQADDAILAVYAVPVVAFLVHFRGVILASRRATFWFGSAIVLFAAAVTLDVGTDLRVEEAIEPLSSLTILVGELEVALEHFAVTPAGRRPLTS